MSPLCTTVGWSLNFALGSAFTSDGGAVLQHGSSCHGGARSGRLPSQQAFGSTSRDLLRTVHILTGVLESLQALCTSQINCATAARFGA